MADQKRAVPENVAGNFFVDFTCINCDTCRQLAPETFADAGNNSCVSHQPANSDEERKALRALLSCPTASIGTRRKSKTQEVVADFPLTIEADVFYCGFNSAKSYGANSFFVRHKDGNWLIDSPRFVKSLVEQFKRLGGIKYIFLSHQDDVADAGKYASTFGASRIIHNEDAQAEPDSEIVIKGEKPKQFGDEFRVIPVPGHTRGHMVLLYKDRYLFAGDHVFFDPASKRLTASRRHCWYSWQHQTESMASLIGLSFEWVLPGHGQRVHFDKKEMRKQMKDLVERMRAPSQHWQEE
ncbi:MAG: MBL fold metallo-hydrolase [Candidatus Melainabacteria bacterium]|nr:MAG: MBL fold metallo-hydrolase [Candidatus Melainabacteria bacterium]